MKMNCMIVGLAIGIVVTGAICTVAQNPEGANPAEAEKKEMPVAKQAEKLAVSDADRKAAEASYKEGLALQEKKDLAGAVAKLNEAIKLDPSHANALNHLAWFLGVDAPAEMKDVKRAETLAIQAMNASEGKNRDIIDTVAELYFQKKDYAKAVEYGKKALEPGMIGPHTTEKYLKEQLEKFEKAAAGK